MKIGLFADSHYCNKEATYRRRRPNLSYGKIREAMDHFKEVDMVICLGDLVDDCDSESENISKIKELAELIRSYNIPFYCMMGNHDYQNFTREEFDGYTNGSYPPFSMKCGDSTLVFLDANYYADGTMHSPGNVNWADANLPEDQIEKLKALLADDNEQNVYIFCHQNLDPGVESQHIIKNAEYLRELIGASGKVKKVIQGHFHFGHDAVIDGVIYHTLIAMCEGEDNYFEIMEIV